MKATLVIGANTNPEKYGCKAVQSLVNHGREVIAYGQHAGVVAGVPIESEWNDKWAIDTVTLYINPLVQEAYYQKIIDLKPRRVIFNPGTENPTFIEQLEAKGILAELSCTLVLLATGQYD